MAAAIPPALKAADIARFAQRAGQVEKAKPAVAYWCNYWIVDQIIAKGLHQADDECKSYTMNLMDKLEQTKSDYTENDAIVDELAGQAYIEQFGLETFERADKTMKANKVSRQTADTFLAAATFLELCQIWSPLEPEIASKIKFAKYHSVRILKAMKAGEDPNLSNPAPEPEKEPPLDPNDPEVQILKGADKHDQNRNIDRQPSVIDVPDEHDLIHGHLAERSTYDESLHPSRAPSVRPQGHPPPLSNSGEDYYAASAPPEVSPIAPSSADRAMSDGGGYFPSVPEDFRQDPNQILPDKQRTMGDSPPAVVLPDSSSLPPPGASGFHTRLPPPIDSLHSFPPPSPEHLETPEPSADSMPAYPSAPPPAAVNSHSFQPPTVPREVPQHPPQPPFTTSSAQPRQNTPARTAAVPLSRDQRSYQADEESILKAQKHARWAISALNFEDVNTAVKELRGALESLGAS